MSILITNAKIFTSNPSNLWTEAIGITNGIITFIGSNDEAESQKSNYQIKINANSKTIVPGFNDAHFHLSTPSFRPSSLDLSQLANISSEDDLKCAISNYYAETGLNFIIVRNLPTSIELSRLKVDKISPQGTKIIITQIKEGKKERGWANTSALRKCRLFSHINCLFEDLITRDEEGYPNSIEGLAIDFVRAFYDGPGNIHYLSQAGITSIHVMGAHSQEFQMFKEMEKDSLITTRLMYAFDMRNLKFLSHFIKENSPLVRVSAIKLYLDGLIENKTSCCSYHHNHDIGNNNHVNGKKNLIKKEINKEKEERMELIKEKAEKLKLQLENDNKKAHFSVAEIIWYLEECEKFGAQLCVHATGDGAVTRVLDALLLHLSNDEIDHQIEKSKGRHRIEHVEVCKEKDLVRFGELGMIASMSPLHADSLQQERYREKIDPKFNIGSFAYKTIKSLGGVVPFSTDYPVVPYFPMSSLQFAVQRKPILKGEEDQSFTLAESIIHYTAVSAYAEFQDHVKGILAPGYYADLTLLSEDIFYIESQNLDKVISTLTICDGRIVWAVPDILSPSQ